MEEAVIRLLKRGISRDRRASEQIRPSFAAPLPARQGDFLGRMADKTMKGITAFKGSSGVTH